MGEATSEEEGERGSGEKQSLYRKSGRAVAGGNVAWQQNSRNEIMKREGVISRRK